MANIQISTDKNTVTCDGTDHNFHSGDGSTCGTCTLFKQCCALQESVANEFPFPCVSDNRPDKQYGNFRLE